MEFNMDSQDNSFWFESDPHLENNESEPNVIVVPSAMAMENDSVDNFSEQLGTMSYNCGMTVGTNGDQWTGDDLLKMGLFTPVVTPPVAEAAAVVMEAAQEVPGSFDAQQEQMKLLDFLGVNKKRDTFNQVKCNNCGDIIDVNAMRDHPCAGSVKPYQGEPLQLPILFTITHPDLNDPMQETTASITLLPDSQQDQLQEEHEPQEQQEQQSNTQSAETEDKEVIFPLDPPCIRLLRENQIRIRRFLKEELKYDVQPVPMVTSLPFANAAATGKFKKVEGPHECSLCDRRFVHASGLLRHIEKHELDLIPSSKSSAPVKGLCVMVKCTVCGRLFYEVKAALEHSLYHFEDECTSPIEMDNYEYGDDTSYESYVDGTIKVLEDEGYQSFAHNGTYYEAKITTHLKMVVVSTVLQCEFCDFIFSEAYFLFKHSGVHNANRNFECFSCGIYLRTAKEITMHWQAECVYTRECIKMLKVTTQRYYNCNVCQAKFLGLDQLHEHRYAFQHFFPRKNPITGALQLPCEYCNVVSSSVQEVVAHFEDKHFKKNQKRDKEGKGPGAVTKGRQYLCDICGKSYTQSSHLWQHLRFHQGVKPFACTEAGCTRKFTIRPDLNDHIRKCHTGERPYHCVICDKRFLTGSVFYQHRLIHRGERRYECEECGKRFYRADALKNHQRIHTGEKPFSCHFCTKSFRQRGDRDKHIRARHSHLDENTRLMMQMHKFQLEAQEEERRRQAQNLPLKYNHETANSDDGSAGDSGGGDSEKKDDFVVIANMPFPKSMFKLVITDIDKPQH